MNITSRSNKESITLVIRSLKGQIKQLKRDKNELEYKNRNLEDIIKLIKSQNEELKRENLELKRIGKDIEAMQKVLRSRAKRAEKRIGELQDQLKGEE